jgi:hypothetical protein
MVYKYIFTMSSSRIICCLFFSFKFRTLFDALLNTCNPCCSLLSTIFTINIFKWRLNLQVLLLFWGAISLKKPLLMEQAISSVRNNRFGVYSVIITQRMLRGQNWKKWPPLYFRLFFCCNCNRLPGLWWTVWKNFTKKFFAYHRFALLSRLLGWCCLNISSSWWLRWHLLLDRGHLICMLNLNSIASIFTIDSILFINTVASQTGQSIILLSEESKFALIKLLRIV